MYKIESLKKISIDYWAKKNKYFSDNSLHSSTSTQLNLLRNRGYLKNFSPSSNYEIVREINGKISQYRNNSFDDILYIFDLIQCWGGKMGKSPYVRTDRRMNEIPRLCPEHWISSYVAGARETITIDEALDHFCSIPMVAESFATKHLMFWHRVPIFDSRMQLLAFGEVAPKRFTEFRGMVEELAAHWKLDDVLVERGLFAFSENYFRNDSLTFRDLVADQTDLSVAKSIAAQN